MKIISLIVIALAAAQFAWCQPGDDTLRFYLSKSNMVIAGEMQEGICSTSSFQACSFSIRVDEAFKGGAVRGDIVAFQTESFWGDYALPCHAEHAKCIVFLTPGKETGHWKVADPWFGMQNYSSFLATSIKRTLGAG